MKATADARSNGCVHGLGLEMGQCVQRILGAVVLAAAVVIAGCATSDDSPGPATRSAAAATTTATARTPGAPASSAAPPPETVPLLQGDNRMRGPGTVFSGCTPDAGDKFTRGGQVFDPLTGTNKPIPQPILKAPEQLVNHFCTVMGTPRNVRVVYIVSVRTPASGLDAEKYSTRIEAFGVNDRAPVAQAPWPADLALDKFSVLAPTEYGFIVRVRSRVVGFDLDTLAVAWQLDEGQLYSDRYNGRSLARELGTQSGQRIVFNSAKDGSEIARFDGIGLAGGTAIDSPHTTADNGFFVAQAGRPDYHLFYFDSAAAALVGPIAPFAQSFQRSGNLLLAYGRGGSDSAYLNVYDMNKKTFVVQKSGNDAAGLGFQHVYLAGKYLYIQNADDSPVIDLTTLNKVASGWHQRPMDVIGDWILVISGKVSNNYATCFDTRGEFICYETGVLYHSPNGSYPGEWY
ncbi:hypothetical protein ACIHAX_25380 [Nocardia sp. NPDC051929]|uniref:hypothetical protein n=1 Tax=Nocardia sp. NPDC051929 TaxID=3364327 RepID=UPI0037CB4D5D